MRLAPPFRKGYVFLQGGFFLEHYVRAGAEARMYGFDELSPEGRLRVERAHDPHNFPLKAKP